MKILNLTLTKHWFEMILNGIKKEEYREIKPYWIARFAQCKGKNNPNITGFYCKKANCNSCLKRGDGFHEIKYDAIRFTNGYGSFRPSMLVVLKNTSIGFGVARWGAPNNEKVFILTLGDILETCNIQSSHHGNSI